MPSFAKCPIHEEPTFFASDITPDENWKEAADRLRKQVEKANELQRVIPLVRGVEPTYQDGCFWVDQEALYRAGAKFNSAPRMGSFHLFELEDGWIYETQGWDERRRRWWVERVIRSSEEESSPPTTSADEPSSTESATD